VLTSTQTLFIQRWIDTLRSGKYQQGRHQLRRDDAYCCLGVLCDMYDPNQWAPDNRYEKFLGMPSDAVIVGVFGNTRMIVTNFLRELAGLNDSNHSFAEIANHIDRWLKIQNRTL
jgi:hypothetical protein